MFAMKKLIKYEIIWIESKTFWFRNSDNIQFQRNDFRYSDQDKMAAILHTTYEMHFLDWK